MKYQLQDNGRPAQYPEVDVHPSWANLATWDTWEEAEEYAKKWLDIYHPGEGIKLGINNEYDYSGYGDICMIVPIEDFSGHSRSTP